MSWRYTVVYYRERLFDFLEAHKLAVAIQLGLLTILGAILVLEDNKQRATARARRDAIPALAPESDELKKMFQAPDIQLPPPSDRPISVEELAECNGTDPSKPIWVAIKGQVFDVSAKKEMYGPGCGYNIFAGKDGSRGLGKSSLKPEDAVADYSVLDEHDMKVLDDWVKYFTKRYAIVGVVTPKAQPSKM